MKHTLDNCGNLRTKKKYICFDDHSELCNQLKKSYWVSLSLYSILVESPDCSSLFSLLVLMFYVYPIYVLTG